MKSTKTRISQDKGVYSEYIYIYNVLNGKEINSRILDSFENHKKLISALNNS